MSSKLIRPSTVDGIKRLAKEIRKARGLKLAEAQDDAARSAGFQNYIHARRSLTEGVVAASATKHPFYISVYWREGRANGRETLRLEVARPWQELMPPTALRSAHVLSDFRVDAPDHLERRHVVRDALTARRVACRVARMFQFMAATGLRPGHSWKRALPGIAHNEQLPGADHSSVWMDPQTARYLLVDEPYAYGGTFSAKRELWARQHGFAIATPAWRGMYNPDGSYLHLVSHSSKGVELGPLVKSLDGLAPPIVEDPWLGESGPIVPPLVTPAARLVVKTPATRAQARRSTGPRKTVAYRQTFVGAIRRPKAKMSLKAHEEVASALKSVYAASYYRPGVRNRVDSVRSELDEWVQREYDHAALPDEKFDELYYGGEQQSAFTRRITAGEAKQHVDRLIRAGESLKLHYPDCPPLRALLNRLEVAVRSMRKWGGMQATDGVSSAL